MEEHNLTEVKNLSLVLVISLLVDSKLFYLSSYKGNKSMENKKKSKKRSYFLFVCLVSGLLLYRQETNHDMIMYQTWQTSSH